MAVQIAVPPGQIGNWHTKEPWNRVFDFYIVIVFIDRIAGHTPVQMVKIVCTGGDNSSARGCCVVFLAHQFLGGDEKIARADITFTSETATGLIVILNIITSPGTQTLTLDNNITASLNLSAFLMQTHPISFQFMPLRFNMHIAGCCCPPALTINLKFISSDIRRFKLTRCDLGYSFGHLSIDNSRHTAR